MSAIVGLLPDVMAGKTVLITGATSGIGRATAVGLAALGARVAINGREEVRTQAAAAEIAAESRNPAVVAFAADLSAQSEVRRLASAVLDAYPRLDVLVNNVGGFWTARRVTPDGIEHTFAVNHLAGFLLTNLLLDRLRSSAPARIVTVSSNAHAMGPFDFDDPRADAGYSPKRAYNQSKLANVMFTYELSRRLAGSGVTATVLHPGMVSTSFAGAQLSPAWKVIVALARPFMKSPAQGALTPIHLASAPSLEGVSGQYFVNAKPRPSHKLSYDEGVSARLWQMSAELVGLP